MKLGFRLKLSKTANHMQRSPNPPGDGKMTNQRNAPPEIGDGEDRAAETGKATITMVATTAETGTGVEATTMTVAGTETRALNT